MLETAVRDNYYALCICILTEKISEEAFVDIGLASKKGIRGRFLAQANHLMDQAPDDIQAMIRLRQTHTWKQIGEIYGISDQAAYQRVKRYAKGRD